MQSQFGKGNGPDINEVVGEVFRSLKSNFNRIGPIIALVVAVLVVAKGVYKIEPGEKGVVLRFGEINRVTEPGLHFAVPLIETYDVVDVQEIRRVEVGFAGDTALPEALMLTGDENIVEVRMVVQYRVSDPEQYLFRLAHPEKTLHTAAEVAIRTVVGQTYIDDVMTKGRATVQSKTRALLQKLMDEYESGLELTEVKLDNAGPPQEVKDAFNAVIRAREEKEKLVNQARGYKAHKIPEAKGLAEKILQDAVAYRSQRISRAEGDTARFLSLKEEYSKAKSVTRQRLYLETMSRVLGNVEDVVLVDGQLSDRAVPLLSLGGSGGGLFGGPLQKAAQRSRGVAK